MIITSAIIVCSAIHFRLYQYKCQIVTDFYVRKSDDISYEHKSLVCEKAVPDGYYEIDYN